jgi:hypothetical protein
LDLFFNLYFLLNKITTFVIMKTNWTGLLEYLQFLIKRNPE